MQIAEPTKEFILLHRTPDADVRQLALLAGKFPKVDKAEALNQIAGWQMALHKLPSWAAVEEILYPPHLSMEQCSSEATARYKRSVIESFGTTDKDTRLVDLTGGFGVDFSFLARGFSEAVYVERQAGLCERALHNMSLLGLDKVTVVEAQAEDYLSDMPPADWIYIDPARRDGHGGKVVNMADCQPDVPALYPLLRTKARYILVKLSPMLDLTLIHRQLPGAVLSTHIVAVAGECKEVLLVLRGLADEETSEKCYAVDFRRDESQHAFSFHPLEEREAVCEYTTHLLTYLYEPCSAILKAGAYRLPAVRFGMKKLHPDSHLYTSDEWQPDFPGRCFQVQTYGSLGKKELKNLLTNLKQAHLTVRGFPATVAELRKRLKLAEGGDTYLFAASLADGNKVLIRCLKKQ